LANFYQNIYIALLTFVICLFGARPLNSQTLSWQHNTLPSIARIQSRLCRGACRNNPDAGLVRVGTGFLTNIEGFDEPVIVTALHVIAGANNIQYHFTEYSQEKPVNTTVVGVDLDADMVLLKVKRPHKHQIRPLSFGDHSLAERKIYIFGHKIGSFSLISDDGRIKLKAPDRFGDLPLTKNDFKLIEEVGYPDKLLEIAVVEEALNSGDSGGPVFDTNGLVIGMVQGGIPSSAAQIAWMIPSRRIKKFRNWMVDIKKLKKYTVRHAYSAYRAFYSADQDDRTPFGTDPKIKFAFTWQMIQKPLKEYAKRLDALASRSIHWLSERKRQGKYGRNISHDEEYFPASSTEPENCFFEPDNIHCLSSKLREKALIETFDDLVIKVICYRESVFYEILASKKQIYRQADLKIEFPVTDFVQRIKKGEIGIDYDWNGPSASEFYLYSHGFLSYGQRQGKYQRHPDINYIEDLFGGACLLYLDAKTDDREDEIQELNRMLRYEAACLHLVLADNTHTPIALTSYLPISDNVARGALWGLLPISKVRGTIDDTECH